MAGVPIGGALRLVHRLFVEGTVAGLSDGQLLDRFLSSRDESAFAALVERHGPMVLGTCRAVLRDPDDAEDAFQATFLVLVRKARSIRGRDALGGWLHQVAHRIAIQAGAGAALKRHRERVAGAARATDGHRAESDDEWRAVLHEEIARLSEKHRLPLLLCDLEGKTQAQAAAELNCGEATVRRRLAGARELLRRRLVRRGIALTAGALATTLGRSALAKVPPGWVATTVKAAGAMSSAATRIAIDEVVSTTAAALARKSLRGMLLSQLGAGAAAAVFLIALAGLAWGVVTFEQDQTEAGKPARMERPPTAATAAPSKAKAGVADDPDGSITYQGRALGPEGRPVAGAAVYLVRRNMKTSGKPRVRANTGPDGRFRFMVPMTEFDLTLENPFDLSRNPPWRSATVLARAPGYVFGLSDHSDATHESTLRLARDDVPIRGRIIDLEGRPVVGATVQVISVRLPAYGLLGPSLKALQIVNAGIPPKRLLDAWSKHLTDQALDGWVKNVESRKPLDVLDYPYLPNHLEGQTGPIVIPDASTGPDGTFRITGIGRGRVAILQIEGAAIETRRVRVQTRTGVSIHTYGPRREPITIYGASFEHAAGPTRPIEGVVRDAETGRPLAGVLIDSIDSRPLRGGRRMTTDAETTSDSQGRYRLVGLPLGREGDIRAIPPGNYRDFNGPGRKEPRRVSPENALHYFSARIPVGHSPGSVPIHLDINLRRGVWITGRVIDKATGRPVRSVVEYFVFQDNPAAKADPPTLDWRHRCFTGDDGAFQLIAYPGRGVLAVSRTGGNHYAHAVGLDTIQDKRKDWHRHMYPRMQSPIAFDVINQIDPVPDTLVFTHDLQLEPATR